MPNRKVALVVAAALVTTQIIPGMAKAENQMGYQLLSPQAAAGLPHNRGSLGMDIERAQQITDGGMTFDIIRVKGVRRGSPGAQAGFNTGDQIIAIDGNVFSNLATFAAYVGSVQPGSAVSVDYIPANGGPAQAQRVAVTSGAAGGGVQLPAQPATSSGMSTGTKVAIGVGAAALLGCYELGCFSHRHPAQASIAGQRSFKDSSLDPNGNDGSWRYQADIKLRPGLALCKCRDRRSAQALPRSREPRELNPTED